MSLITPLVLLLYNGEQRQILINIPGMVINIKMVTKLEMISIVRMVLRVRMLCILKFSLGSSQLSQPQRYSTRDIFLVAKQL